MMESSLLLGASTLYDFVTRLDGRLMILGRLTCTLMILVVVVVVGVMVSEDGFHRLNTQRLCENDRWWIVKQQIPPPGPTAWTNLQQGASTRYPGLQMAPRLP